MIKRKNSTNPLVIFAVLAWSLLICLIPLALIVALIRWLLEA